MKIALICPASLPCPRIPHDYRIVLFVERLVEYKGCHHLINAMRYVKEKFPKTALVIVGSKGFGNKLMGRTFMQSSL